MLINEYSLIGNSYGRGYKDDPYVMDDLYVRGDSSVTWQVIGTGRFGINLSDMTTQLFEEGIYNTLISIFVNDVLVKVANSLDETVSDFGVLLDLDDDISNIRLSFNGFDNSLLYINKISSFLYKDSPEPATSAETTVPPESDDREEDPIRDNGVRLLSFDLDASCGPHSIRVLPNTGEFHILDNEVWFTGNQSVQREYNVRVQAFNNDGVITSRGLSFAVLDCDSSSSCLNGNDGDGDGGDGDGDGDSGGGGGSDGGGNGNVDDSISTIRNISPSLGECGTNDNGTFVAVSISWTGDQDKSSDIQISQGNSFGILYLEHLSIVRNNLQVLLPVDEIFFLRGRQRAGASVSEWSGVLQFDTQTTEDCTGTVAEPAPPETSPIPCLDLVPPEDPIDPIDPTDPNPDPSDPRYPEDPSPGPQPCRGNGCREDEDDEEGPRNPDSDNPCCRTTPGCIGPGCRPGSGPRLPGGGDNDTGDSGGPGGPNDPNPPEQFPPSPPRPPSPTCEDGKIHRTILDVENQDDNKILEVIVTWQTADSCQDYLESIGATAGDEVVPSVSVEAGQVTSIDLEKACPECVKVCLKGDRFPASYKLNTVAIDDRGNLEAPYTYIESTEMAQPQCTCENLSIESVYPNINTVVNGDTYRLRIIDKFDARYSDHTKVLKRETGPDERCFEFQAQVIRANGTVQERKKLMCFTCDGINWVDITNDIIDCEVAFFKRYASAPPVKYVSYQDHWNMTQNTYAWSNNGWPDTNFGSWGKAGGSPFMSKGGWDLTYDQCVTCCEVESVDDPNNPFMNEKMLGPVSGNTVSNVSRGDAPYNNKNCLPTGQIQDPNLEGLTGRHNGERSHIVPCSPPLFSSYTMGDTLGPTSQMYFTVNQLGFAQITQNEINNLGTEVSCVGTVDSGPPCTAPTNGDYSYLLSFKTIKTICTGADGRRNRYKLEISPTASSPIVTGSNWGVDSRASNDNCNALFGNRYTAVNAAFTTYVGTWVTPYGQSGSPYWGAGGMNPDDEGNDRLRVGEERYTMTAVFEPFTISDAGNPLP